MSAEDCGPVETWPVAQSSARAETTPAVCIGEVPGVYSYAVLRHDGEINIHGFPDRNEFLRALAHAYTRDVRWQWPRSWDRVFVLEPDKPLRLYLVVEDEDGDQGVA